MIQKGKIKNCALQFLKNETKTFNMFYLLYMKDVEQWMVGGLQNVQTNISIFMFIILQVNYSVLKNI